MRILHVGDDRLVELLPKAEGFNVYTTDLGEEGVDLAKIYDYDLILLDTTLPDISGLEALRQIRAAGVATPAMVVSDRSDIETKVRALTDGADDYIVKPVHKDELIARAHSIIRRSKGHADALVTAGPITVNLDQKTVAVGGEPVDLTGKEYQMLELLALRQGQAITRDMILNHLYGGMDEPEIKIIDVFICKLRSKLRLAGAAGYIQTVWGRGYRLMTEAGEDRVQRQGTSESLVGRILSLLADARPRRSFDIADALSTTLTSVRGTLPAMRDRGYLSKTGWTSHYVTWSITSAGIEENNRRHALAAAA